MNKLLGMLAYTRVVECGSFTRAAERMGISVSAVTKNVGKLEEDIGTQLLVRTTRRVTVTDFGREYYASCRRIFGEIDNVEAALRESQDVPRGKVSLLCPAFFGRVHLLPNLKAFYARYPQIEVELVFGAGYEDIVESGINLAVVVGQVKDTRFETQLLTRGQMVCCATPAYLREHGTPQVIDDLLSHNCLVSNYAMWRFREGGRIVELPVKGNLIAHAGDALREATLLGLGIAQTNWWLLRNDIASGALVEVLKPYRVPGRQMSVVYPRTKFMPRKVRAMVDFLIEITKVSAQS